MTNEEYEIQRSKLNEEEDALRVASSKVDTAIFYTQEAKRISDDSDCIEYGLYTEIVRKLSAMQRDIDTNRWKIKGKIDDLDFDIEEDDEE